MSKNVAKQTKEVKNKASQLATGKENIDSFLGINSRLEKTLTINNEDIFTTINGDNGETTEISQAVYKFATNKGERTQITLYDYELIQSTERIKKAMQGRNLLTLVICKELSNINESGKLEKIGFKNIAEYGHYLFNLQTSTVNHYARIGKNFINDDYTIKGGLPELSVSHFVELNSLVGENGELAHIRELFINGTLSDGMSTKDFRKAIKEISSPQIEDNSNKEETKENSNEESQNTATVSKGETYNISQFDGENFDTQVVVGQVLNKCNDLLELFELMKKNEVQVVGYEENIEKIKSLVKTLIQ